MNITCFYTIRKLNFDLILIFFAKIKHFFYYWNFFGFSFKNSRPRTVHDFMLLKLNQKYSFNKKSTKKKQQNKVKSIFFYLKILLFLSFLFFLLMKKNINIFFLLTHCIFRLTFFKKILLLSLFIKESFEFFFF